jgi:hypothetical protein
MRELGKEGEKLTTYSCLLPLHFLFCQSIGVPGPVLTSAKASTASQRENLMHQFRDNRVCLWVNAICLSDKLQTFRLTCSGTNYKLYYTLKIRSYTR